MQTVNVGANNLAIEGYDPVSYFAGGPVKGQPNVTSTHAGAVYQFATPENKAQFDANPEQYLPQYGGFCATGMSENSLVPIDPQTYIVADNKLYLFYNGEAGNTKPMWEADEPTRRANADRYWAAGNYTQG